MVTRQKLNITTVVVRGITFMLSLLLYITATATVTVNASEGLRNRDDGDIIVAKSLSSRDVVKTVMMDISGKITTYFDVDSQQLVGLLDSDGYIVGNNDYFGYTKNYASENEMLVLFNGTMFNEFSLKDKKAVMTFILTSIDNADTDGNQTLMQMYQFFESQDSTTANLVKQLNDDVKADYISAYSILRPFTGGYSTVLGILCLVMFALLTLTFVIDLAFIVLPVFRNFLTDTLGEHPKFVSKEAVMAVREAEGDHLGKKDAVWIYFKGRVKVVIVLGIVLLYLVGGKIYDIVGLIIDYLENIIG